MIGLFHGPCFNQRLGLECSVCQEEVEPLADAFNFENLVSLVARGHSIFEVCICGNDAPDPADRAYQKRFRRFVGSKLIRDVRDAAKTLKAGKEVQRPTPPGASLAGKNWYGICPHDNVWMYLNMRDLYECAECGLQVCVSHPAQVLSKAGSACFRLNKNGRRVSAQGTLPGPVEIHVDGRY